MPGGEPSPEPTLLAPDLASVCMPEGETFPESSVAATGMTISLQNRTSLRHSLQQPTLGKTPYSRMEPSYQNIDFRFSMLVLHNGSIYMSHKT